MTTNFEFTAPVLPKSKVRRYLWALVLSGVAIYFFLPHFAAMGHAFVVISNLRIHFVALSIAAQVLSYAGSGYLLSTVVRLAARRISIVDGALMTVAGNSVGTLGGGVLATAGMTYLWLRRRGVSAGAAGLGAWLPILLNNTVLATLSVAGFVVIIHLRKSSGMLVAGFALVCLILAAVLTGLLLCLHYRDKLTPIAMSLARFIAKIRHKPLANAKVEAVVEHLLDGWDDLIQGGWRGPMVGAILNTSFDMLTLGILFWATGYHVSITVLFAGYGIPQMLGKFTLILGGLGVIETSMVGLYTLLGAPKPIAVIAVLAYRLLSFWIPTLVGVALVPYLERWTGSTARPTAAVESGPPTGELRS